MNFCPLKILSEHEFFAGIALWLTPRVEDETLAHLAFRTKRGSFESVSLLLENFTNEEDISLNFDNISLPTIEDLETYSQERVIDYEQVKLFEKIEIEEFVDVVFLEFEESNETFMKDEFNLKHLALTQFHPEAKHLGFETETGIYFYILLCCLTNENVNSQKIKTKMNLYEEEFQKINFLKEEIENYRKKGDKL